jgi:23S rRNA pseudouridine955/2504/2580 synthase
MKELVITANEAGQRFDKFLKKYLKGMPLSAIYKTIRTKGVTVNGKKSSEKYVLNNGDIVNFYVNVEEVKKEKDLTFLHIDHNFEVVYEDENLLLVNKSVGKLVHPDEGGGVTLTDEVLSFLYDKGEYNPDNESTFSPSPCNRLDRNTEGIVIFAKNYDTLKLVNEMIREGRVEKYYSTLVKNRIKDGTYKAYILKDVENNKVTVSEEKIRNGKEIVTRVINIESIGQFSHVDIELITGRSHQIRAHLSWMGNAIVGDPKYGDRKMNSFFTNKYGLENQLLVAYKVVFRNCPEQLSYLEGKAITMALPQLFKKIKHDLFKI